MNTIQRLKAGLELETLKRDVLLYKAQLIVAEKMNETHKEFFDVIDNNVCRLYDMIGIEP